MVGARLERDCPVVMEIPEFIMFGARNFETYEVQNLVMESLGWLESSIESFPPTTSSTL